LWENILHFQPPWPPNVYSHTVFCHAGHIYNSHVYLSDMWLVAVHTMWWNGQCKKINTLQGHATKWACQSVRAVWRAHVIILKFAVVVLRGNQIRDNVWLGL